MFSKTCCFWFNENRVSKNILILMSVEIALNMQNIPGHCSTGDVRQKFGLKLKYLLPQLILSKNSLILQHFR